MNMHPQEVRVYLEEQERRYAEFTQQHPLPPELVDRLEPERGELLAACGSESPPSIFAKPMEGVAGVAAHSVIESGTVAASPVTLVR